MHHVKASMENHISLSQYFDKESLIKENLDIGKETISMYEGGLYEVMYKGQSKFFTGSELAQRGDYARKSMRIISVKKGDQILLNRQEKDS